MFVCWVSPGHTPWDRCHICLPLRILKQDVRSCSIPIELYRTGEVPGCRYPHCPYPRTSASYNERVSHCKDAWEPVRATYHSAGMTEACRREQSRMNRVACSRDLLPSKHHRYHHRAGTSSRQLHSPMICSENQSVHVHCISSPPLPSSSLPRHYDSMAFQYRHACLPGRPILYPERASGWVWQMTQHLFLYRQTPCAYPIQ